MTREITVSVPKNAYKWFNDVYLIHGLSRRAIRVVVRPFASLRNKMDLTEESSLIQAATIAARNGWKTIFIYPDDYYQEGAYYGNSHMFTRDVYNYTGYLGKFFTSTVGYY